MSIGYGVKIIVENTNKEFHSLKDWGLVIGNNNYIGSPVQETNYVTIPGASSRLDLSEAITGSPVFVSREINVKLGGVRPRMNWDNTISELRNAIEGKIVKLIFDNDIGFYWRGRCTLTGYDRARSVGTINLKIAVAEPYKYEIFSSMELWKWDSFNFINGVIRYLGQMDIDNTEIVIPKGNMEAVPVFRIDSITSEALFVTVNGITYTLAVGYNRFPQIKVAGTDEVVLTFVGTGTGAIEYRGGSL